MKSTLQDYLDYLKFTEPLLNPNHAYTSERMLGRRFLGERGEDQLPRICARLADLVDGPVLSMQRRKLCLPTLGLALRNILQQLVASGTASRNPIRWKSSLWPLPQPFSHD